VIQVAIVGGEITDGLGAMIAAHFCATPKEARHLFLQNTLDNKLSKSQRLVHF
jgi:hypothetical protein